MSQELVDSVNGLTTQATELLGEYSETKAAIEKTHQEATQAKNTAEALFSIKKLDGSGQETLYLTESHFFGNQILTVETAANIDTVIVVPNGLTVSQPLMIVRLGDGLVKIAGTTSVALHNSQGGNALPAKYSVASLLPIKPNQYLLVGELWYEEVPGFNDVTV